jgi:hypothetical protein
MKNTLLLAVLSFLAVSAFAVGPQTDADREDLLSKMKTIYTAEDLPERYKNYRMKYIQSFDAPFEDVFNAVIENLNETSCRTVVDKQSMTDEGFFKGVIKSDYCVFVNNVDGIVDSLDYYSVKVPFIRGSIWETGRMKYTFILRESEEGPTSVEVRGEISGLESNITETIHFWESNGNFEVAFLNNVADRLAL